MMRIYNLISGIGEQERIAISGITLEISDQLQFMNPDRSANVSPDARHKAADKWPGLQVRAETVPDKRVKPYFQDAIGPGFSLPGCDLAVSEYAYGILKPILGAQARFLPLDVVGAPAKYWGFYATQYFGELNEELSVFSPPYDSAPDQRRMLRHAAFKLSEHLGDIYVFRVPGTVDYVPPDMTYATQKFVDLLIEHNLGGFNFLNISYKGFKRDPLEPPVIVTKGPKYLPSGD